VLFLANYIPEEKISEIRSIADIVEVVAESVLLKKAGNNYFGLCPFHSEKTPSFSVNPDKQIFHCFGCGVGGNVFSFLMKQEGLTFPEAVRVLARRYGIEIPRRRMTAGEKRKLDEKEQFYAINRVASEYYRRTLESGSGGGPARAYLEKRRFKTEVIADFNLGYAPTGWDNLLGYLRRKNIRPDLIEKCGLIIPRKNSSGYYDRFRNRIVFPIFDTHMRVTGFGGRVLDDSLPKYLNSPETPIYSKSRSLYGLHRAKSACRQNGIVYIVEGYLDLLALHQHGFINSVATLGTALTSEHVRILRGCIGEAGRAVLVYDSDEAGINAARRSVAVFDKEFVNAQILVLDSGYDPDQYLGEFGAEAFRKRSGSAMNVVPFLLETAVKKHGLSVEGKVRIVADLQPTLAAITDSVERSLYVREVAERLGVDEKALAAKIVDTPAAATGLAGKYSKIHTTNTERQDGSKLEHQILSMMLQYPVVLPHIREMDVIAYFDDPALKSIAKIVLEMYQTQDTGLAESATDNLTEPEPVPVAAIIDKVEDDQKCQLIAGLTNRVEQWTLEGCLRVIKRFVNLGQDRLINRGIDEKIKTADKNKDKKLLEKLLREKQDLAVESNKRKMAILRKF
jgi:DNA primase